ncbi:hypothetical protein ACAG24_000800 [Mycobacterium sp. pW049]|uniref:hypothetical protein n=1 Tax=[Mycobacterium] bulgaricum TaxID=3238985 RepID=UPI00351B59A8
MNITRFGIAVTGAVLTASTLVGCSQLADLRAEASHLAEQVVTTGTQNIVSSVSGDLFTAEGIDNAYAEISEKAGGAPMRVVEVTIVPGVLTLQAIDPAAPTELNQWSYTAGAVGPSRPVDYDDDTEALRQNLFSVDEVPATAVASAIDRAVAQSGIPGGEVSSLIIKRNLPFDENVMMFLNIEGERSSKQVRADVTGQIVEVI